MKTLSMLWLIMTVYHEARGESVDGQKAVAKVILNRSVDRSKSIEEIVREELQFSCYNEGLPGVGNVPVLMRVAAACDEAVKEWRTGDNLQGANLYYNPKLANPAWAKSPKVDKIAKIGNHVFMREAWKV